MAKLLNSSLAFPWDNMLQIPYTPFDEIHLERPLLYNNDINDFNKVLY